MKIVSPIVSRPLIGIWMLSVACTAPIIQGGNSTPTSRAPKIVRRHCCMISDSPQVASSVSKGRLYRCRISSHSVAKPSRNDAPNATTVAPKKYTG